MLKDSEKIQRWDLWFDEHIPAWRAVSDDWAGKKSGTFPHVFVRYESEE